MIRTIPGNYVLGKRLDLSSIPDSTAESFRPLNCSMRVCCPVQSTWNTPVLDDLRKLYSRLIYSPRNVMKSLEIHQLQQIHLWKRKPNSIHILMCLQMYGTKLTVNCSMKEPLAPSNHPAFQFLLHQCGISGEEHATQILFHQLQQLAVSALLHLLPCRLHLQHLLHSLQSCLEVNTASVSTDPTTHLSSTFHCVHSLQEILHVDAHPRKKKKHQTFFQCGIFHSLCVA
mmetsp:Transcript_7370/g.13304  ORF Transcript_7370/g.13304 Transcript_7370/m.13304 type:complete len:229 (-) Transcript_7370:734-1420(-)